MLMQYLLHNLPTVLGWIWRSIIEVYIQFVNYLSHVSLFHELMYIGGILGILLIVAYEIQYHLNRSVGSDADREHELQKAAETKTAEELAKLEEAIQKTGNRFYRRRWIYEGLYL